jgi:hypothetical protein
MRRASIFVAALIIGTAMTGAAIASSVHFKKGGTPTCTISGGGTSSTSTTCTGSIAGLGGGDVTINTTVQGFAVYTCTNQGGNAAPGQNQVQVGPSTTPTNISGNEIKNGNLTFTTQPAALAASETVTGAQAGCPNNNWTGTNPQLTLTSITLQIYQGGQLLFTCTASNNTGLSGTVPLSC